MLASLRALAIALLLAAAGGAHAQSLDALAERHGATGFGFVWTGDQGLWFQPDGRAVWISRGNGLVPRYFDQMEFQGNRVCMVRTHFLRSRNPNITCVTIQGGRCTLSRVQSPRTRDGGRCAPITSPLPQWSDFRYDARHKPNSHCCEGPRPPIWTTRK